MEFWTLIRDRPQALDAALHLRLQCGKNFAWLLEALQAAQVIRRNATLVRDHCPQRHKGRQVADGQYKTCQRDCLADTSRVTSV
jgi:hypothetical protein